MSENAGAMVSAEMLAKEKRAFLASFAKVADLDKAVSKVHSTEITLVLIILGKSKVGEDGFSKMVYTYLPDQDMFRERFKLLPETLPDGSIELVTDARGKEQREKDAKVKDFDLEKCPIYDSWQVEGTTDREGNIRRVRITLKPEMISFRNEKIMDIPSNAIVVASIEAAAWHDDDYKVVVSPKIVSIGERLIFAERDFIEACHTFGLASKSFKTKVRYYANKMHQHFAAGGTKEKADPSWRYRNDNQFAMVVGFENRLALELTKPMGCFFQDITSITTESNLIDTRNEKVRYFATYHGRQWVTDGQGKRVNTDFTVDIAMFDQMERFGISSLDNWKIFCPILMSKTKMLIVAAEDAERSYNSKLVQERIFESDDPDFLNRPRENSVSFSLGTSVRSVVFDAVATIKQVSIPVSPATVKDKIWLGEKPSTIPPKVKPLKGIDSRLVNLSEMSNEDHLHYVDNPNNQLRVLINLAMTPPARGVVNVDIPSILENMDVKTGDQLYHYLSECVLAGPGNNIRLEEFISDLSPEDRASVMEPSHPINQIVFTPPNGMIVQYVYAIKNDLIEKEKRRFQATAGKFNLRSILTLPSLETSSAPALSNNKTGNTSSSTANNNNNKAATLTVVEVTEGATTSPANLDQAAAPQVNDPMEVDEAATSSKKKASTVKSPERAKSPERQQPPQAQASKKRPHEEAPQKKSATGGAASKKQKTSETTAVTTSGKDKKKVQQSQVEAGEDYGTDAHQDAANNSVMDEESAAFV